MSAISISFIFSLILAINLVVALKTAIQEEEELGSLVRKDERKLIASTEYGSISAVTITDGKGSGSGSRYHLQFISMDPNSLFLPALLHADMIFYVHTGSGKLSWTDENKLSQVNLETGDVYRLRSGTIFYIQSSLEPERDRLRINAIFANPGEDLQESVHGAYSSINDMIRGFDKRVLQTAFKVPEELIEEITSETKTPQIVHAEPRKKDTIWDKEVKFIKSFLQMKEDAQNKKTKTFNFFKKDPDFENCNGWSKVVTKSDLHALRGTHIGVYMVNLTKGSMMGPHWNPSATEISIVLQGEGMVRVVCPSSLTETECNNTRFRIKVGDVFSVPKYHPMTQISFNNDSLVFMGFSTTSKKNHPQFLAGKASVLGALDRHVLETSFDVNATTIDQLLAAQADSIILECTSCAEGEERLLGEEIEKARQEEEEEAGKREEEKQRKRGEEARKREEEEQRKREEEEEEERRREAEDRKREEEKQRRRAEEEEARKREEEEQRKREEEEKERRGEEEEQRREEKEARRREEKEARKREEEEARKREEEQRRLEEEEQRRQQEEERRRQEEQRRRPEEEQRRQEKEERRRQERQRQEEEEQRRREEEERRREEAEEEQARREEEERIERQRQEEEASRRRREEEGREHRGHEPQEEEQPREEIEQEQAAREEEASRRRREEEGREHRGHEPQEEEQPREEIKQEQAAREEEERIERDIQEEEASRRRREEAREHQPQHKEPRVGEHIREKQSEERSRPRRKEIQSINKGGEMGLQARREDKAARKPEPVSGEAGKYEEFIEKQEKRQTQISMREGRRFLKSKFKFGNAIKF